MNTISEETIKKRFTSAFTACGFLMAHYLYIAAYSMFSFIRLNDDSYLVVLIYLSLAALFLWLLREAKKDKKMTTMLTILMVYFGERIYMLTCFTNNNSNTIALIHFIIGLPIVFFLIRGLKASADLEAVMYSRQVEERDSNEKTSSSKRPKTVKTSKRPTTVL